MRNNNYRKSGSYNRGRSSTSRPYSRNNNNNGRRRTYQSFDPLEKEFPKNERIHADEVRVIGPNKENLGVMKTKDALDRAREEELDLVLIAAQARPPVCKIIDWKSFRYQHLKKEKENKKKQKVAKMKEVKMSPKIAGGDLDRKINKVYEIIGEGDQVKITIMRKWPVTPEGTRAFKDQLLTKIEDSCNIINVQEKGRNIYIIVKAKAENNAETKNK